MYIHIYRDEKIDRIATYRGWVIYRALIPAKEKAIDLGNKVDYYFVHHEWPRSLSENELQ